jgi:hypothetical protein
MSANTCLYCSQPALSLEHVLPAAFGEFQGAPLLPDRICTTCNNQRLGVLDEQLTRCGPEAFIRRYYDVKGRAGHDSVNPFYRGSAGGERLEMRVYDPNLGFEVLMERTDGVNRQLRQLVFIEQQDKKTHHLPIREDITPEQLRAAYDRLGAIPPLDMHLICGPEELDWVQDLVRRTSPSVSFGPSTPGTTNYGKGAVIRFGLNERYFRAVAKIGFHYFLAQFPEYTGHEPQFAAVRQFIADGGAGVDRANEYVGERQLPLLAQMLGNARPDGWVGHALAADVTNGEYRAHVQLFISEDFQPRIHTVRLGHDSTDRNVKAQGHAYIYFPDGRHGKFSGDTHVMDCMRYEFPPQPLAPVVRPPSQS